jgi:hypothetical protein
MRGTQVKNYWLVCPFFLVYNSLLNSERPTMNNRIFELANQVLPRETEFHQGDPKEYAYFFASHELQQFAELIVKECIQFCGHPDSIRVKSMKSHFGVE